MDRFKEAEFEPVTREKVKALARSSGQSMNQVKKLLLKMRETDRVFLNDTYQVNVSEVDTPIGRMLWLSVKRRDKNVIHDWRDLQEIKNQLVGPEHEGVELYPAESRKVDTSNQYHLFVFADPDKRYPFGYWDREVMDGDGEIGKDGTRQRPLSGGGK